MSRKNENADQGGNPGRRKTAVESWRRNSGRDGSLLPLKQTLRNPGDPGHTRLSHRHHASIRKVCGTDGGRPLEIAGTKALADAGNFRKQQSGQRRPLTTRALSDGDRLRRRPPGRTGNGESGEKERMTSSPVRAETTARRPASKVPGAYGPRAPSMRWHCSPPPSCKGLRWDDHREGSEEREGSNALVFPPFSFGPPSSRQKGATYGLIRSKVKRLDKSIG